MDDILLHLIPYIGIRRSRLVCKKWERLTNSLPISVVDVSNKMLTKLSKKMNIQSVSSDYLTKININITSLSTCNVDVSHLTNLTYLHSYIKCDISQLTKLTYLHDDSTNPQRVPHLPNLTYLNVKKFEAYTLINLTCLNVDHGDDSDLSTLSLLTNLTKLTIGSLSDMIDFSVFVNLTYLYLYKSYINLKLRLVSLKKLKLYSNSGIIDMVTPNLEHLDCKYCNLDIPTLTKLRKLILHADDVIHQLYGYPNLTYLTIHNGILDYIPPDLTTLSLINVNSYINMTHLTNLTFLSLIDCPNVSDIVGPNLTSLTLQRTSVPSISAPSLKILKLYWVDIPISDWNLETLYIHNDTCVVNSLTSLTSLKITSRNRVDASNLTNLTTLKINSHSTGIENLVKLTKLRCIESDISCISTLTNLTILDASFTSISDISMLTNLRKLTSIGTNIDNVSELDLIELNRVRLK